MQYFCTLFDSFYLSRGLVMYRSLKKHCPDFHLYMFPFDDTAFRILNDLKLESVTLIPLREFENPDLLAVKGGRTKGEYCWTCTSSTIDYCLSTFNLPHCTYVDADLCFYADPIVLQEEMGEQSVLITEHRYTPRYDQSATSGKFCVQYLTFRANEDGKRVLHWWRDRCIEWCYARFEDGKFGDQKYLDNWLTQFKGVHNLLHAGAGVAPWNIQQYVLFREAQRWYLRVNRDKSTVPLIFYHFHHVRFMSDGTVDLSDIYDLGSSQVLPLYQEYLVAIDDVNKELKQRFDFAPRTSSRDQHGALYRIAKRLYNRLQQIRGIYNNIPMERFVHQPLY